MNRVLVFALLALAAGCADRGSPPEPPASSPRERPLAQDGTAARALTSTPDRVPDMRQEMARVVGRMTRQAPVDALVVACTDLFELMEPGAKLVDPIDCHIRAALAR